MLIGLLAGPLAGQALPRDPPAPANAVLAQARAALDSGQAWHATVLLRPLLRDPASRSQEIDLLAATAAAGWEGWSEVERILGRARWLDLDFGGAARALLARAALARGDSVAAAGHARLALGSAVPESLPARHLLLARAFERTGAADSAAVHYRAAWDGFPDLADWLALRLAAVTNDSAARQALYRALRSPAAQARTPTVEAQARRHFGDYAGAARWFDRAGDPVRSLDAAYRGATTDSARAAVRTTLLALITSATGTAAQARAAIALYDQIDSVPPPETQLLIARRAASLNLFDRAGRGFGAANRLLTDQDRFTYGTVLVRLGREELAIPQFALVRDSALRGQARYQRARSMLRAGGSAGGVRDALAAVQRDFPDDVEAASSAVYLSGDLAADAGADREARAAFRTVATRYPTSRFAERAEFQAALLAYVLGFPDSAAAEFDAIVRERPTGVEAAAAAYWGGRARAASGDSTGAARRWTALAARADGSYYASLAARALGRPEAGAGPPPAGITYESTPAIDSALARIRRLDAVGLATEATLERDALEGSGTSTEALLRLASAFQRAGNPAAALRLANRAASQGAPRTRALLGLLYPLPFRYLVEQEARRLRLDPFLVAALIRQESAFDPRARSIADARGLMQVLPSLGMALASAAAIDPWDPALLNVPDINIAFGAIHLQETLDRYGGDVVRALAAYNAGMHRVAQWETKAGVRNDPALFVERIPFTETRDYVRRVTQNLTLYRLLYGADSAGVK